ncbi:DUF1501 domain-containing protein [Sphingomonas nostoxanthinifaciens]|uniref:DUF1501 domain-containing protein n=1 Tax=Sphingomonas nostoxanthinifaciens TaxID=2872652 RepID=UPI001CC21AE3|nr:DUF1501 domain-containing protein [Sphingomonas nostoxanthinifaciens]UAK23262.1 DUF1501 domain-containing protein [Sphingomonas nostoxanthinifaciens]
MTTLSRRSFGKLAAGTGALAALSQIGRSSALAATSTDFRATVGIFLYGGNDSWNMIVPTDARYAGYAASRGTALALPQASLVPLTGSAYGLHPAMAALQPVWNAGGLNVVLNTGTLYAPIDKTLYNSRPDLRPTNLMSHADEQAHWQGLLARDNATDGFLGRLNDKLAQNAISPVMSFAGSDLILLGQQKQALVLPIAGGVTRNGANTGSPNGAPGAREAALVAFAQPSDASLIFSQTSGTITGAYGLVDQLNSALVTSPPGTDAYFVDPATGTALSSNIAKQLMRIARMIASRDTLGHARQAYFATQGSYDTHSAQGAASGTQANLLKDLALAMAGFYNAMGSLGLQQNVTAFTMSDFGRTFRGNASGGSDHAWGGNHLVVGGALKPQLIHGKYPDTTLGGADDADTVGRFIPTIAQEEYLGAIMRWHGVAATDMSYVFPNWATWNANGRGPVPMFA